MILCADTLAPDFSCPLSPPPHLHMTGRHSSAGRRHTVPREEPKGITVPFNRCDVSSCTLVDWQHHSAARSLDFDVNSARRRHVAQKLSSPFNTHHHLFLLLSVWLKCQTVVLIAGKCFLLILSAVLALRKPPPSLAVWEIVSTQTWDVC